MTGAEAVVRCLEAEGVELVFGYPGVAICPFYNAILDADIKTVLVRQEQNAAHAASGYARTTGKIGVVAVTSGPGATNLITGIATAFADSIPMICITGQVDSRLMGSDVFQEADISGACESFVKYSYIVRRASDIPRIMKEAFYIAGSGRKGPVLIDIPIDIQNESMAKFQYPDTITMRTYKPTVKGHAVQIGKVIRELAKAKRPVICAGGGVRLSGAKSKVRAFAQEHGIPVVSTMMGIGVMPTEHPLYYGMVGNNGTPCGNRAMNEADLIIMAGARVADRSISQPDLITEGKVLVHIDVDPAEIGKNAGPSIPLVGDISNVFDDMAERELTADYSSWRETLDGYRTMYAEKLEEKLEKGRPNSGVQPAELIRALSGAMDDGAIYVADVGQNQLWSCAYCIVREGEFFTSGGMGTMGYAVPAAMGCKIADPNRQVVAVCGDGGFQMTMQELGTMHQYGVPVKVVILRNDKLGLVRQYQHLNYNDRWSVTDLDGTPKLDMIAKAYDMDYDIIDDEKDMDRKIKAFLKKDGAAILECLIDKDELA